MTTLDDLEVKSDGDATAFCPVIASDQRERGNLHLFFSYLPLLSFPRSMCFASHRRDAEDAKMR